MIYWVKYIYVYKNNNSVIWRGCWATVGCVIGGAAVGLAAVVAADHVVDVAAAGGHPVKYIED